MEIAIIGPQKVTGVSETPSRKLIFSCHPTAAAAAARVRASRSSRASARRRIVVRSRRTIATA